MNLDNVIVAVTRPLAQAGSLSSKLLQAGATAIEVPLIRIEPLPFQVSEDYDWVVFTSVNAVNAFEQLPLGKRPSGKIAAGKRPSGKIAAVGRATAEALNNQVDLIPDEFTAESLAAVFPEGDGRVLFPSAEGARETIPTQLEAKGWAVDVVPVYRTVATQLTEQEVQQLESADVVTFSSPSAVYSYAENIGVPKALTAFIGPVSAEAATKCEFKVDVIASKHTSEGIVEALIGYCEQQRL